MTAGCDVIAKSPRRGFKHVWHIADAGSLEVLQFWTAHDPPNGGSPKVSMGMNCRPADSTRVRSVGACQCFIGKFISSGGGIMLSFRFVMIQSEPTTTKNTMRMPNASASTLLVLSGPVVMCRKKTR